MLGLNLLLLSGVGLVGWDMVRTRTADLAGMDGFDPQAFALDEASTGPARELSVVWRALDRPRPKPVQTPRPTLEAPTATASCPWTLALVLLDEERPSSGSVILKDGSGRQTAVGVGKHVDPNRKAFRLDTIRIEEDAAQVHAIATLIRVADESPIELRLTRAVRRTEPEAITDN